MIRNERRDIRERFAVHASKGCVHVFEIKMVAKVEIETGEVVDRYYSGICYVVCSNTRKVLTYYHRSENKITYFFSPAVLSSSIERGEVVCCPLEEDPMKNGVR